MPSYLRRRAGLDVVEPIAKNRLKLLSCRYGRGDESGEACPLTRLPIFDAAKTLQLISLGDIARVYKSTGNILGLANAEMEVVKTGGGNWAEHRWVKDQLRVAIVQQDGTEAIEHNFRLYQKYSQELDTIVD